MNTVKRSSRDGRAALAALLAAALAGPAMGAWAQDSYPGLPTSRAGFSLGGRAMHYKASEADHGTWSGGAQARLHITPVFALEGSVDYRQTRFGGVTADVVPVQASLLVYLFPTIPITPYLLAGGGWYYTRLRAPVSDTQDRWGPHAGAGAELFMSHSWSMDASYRHVWNRTVHSTDPSHPLGNSFSDNGNMFTLALNYFF